MIFSSAGQFLDALDIIFEEGDFTREQKLRIHEAAGVAHATELYLNGSQTADSLALGAWHESVLNGYETIERSLVVNHEGMLTMLELWSNYEPLRLCSLAKLPQVTAMELEKFKDASREAFAGEKQRREAATAQALEAQKVALDRDHALALEQLARARDDAVAAVELRAERSAAAAAEAADDARKRSADRAARFATEAAQAEAAAALAAAAADRERSEAALREALDAQRDLAGKACFYSGKPATHMALFARAF